MGSEIGPSVDLCHGMPSPAMIMMMGLDPPVLCRFIQAVVAPQCMGELGLAFGQRLLSCKG